MDKTFALGKDIYLETIDFIKERHGGQFRAFSMCPYWVHPIRVASLVMKYKKSHHIDDLVIAALLHDTLEDTATTMKEIESRWGAVAAGLVHELTSDKKTQKEMGKAKYLTFKMRHMTPWALTLKLCDRLDNVMDFAYADESFIQKYGKETNDILNGIMDIELSDTQKKIISNIDTMVGIYYREII